MEVGVSVGVRGKERGGSGSGREKRRKEEFLRDEKKRRKKKNVSGLRTKNKINAAKKKMST